MTPEEAYTSTLYRAAVRARNNPFYLASALAIYQASEDMDDQKMAEFLGCDLGMFSQLALCRKPGVIGAAEFGADIKHLVTRFNLQRDRLVQMLNEAEFLSEARRQRLVALTFNNVATANATVPSRLLLAAHDRMDDENDGSSEEHQK